MAALAVFEGEIAAERTFAVVTGETRAAASGGEVFRCGRRAYLTSLCGAGGGPVAVSAGETFSCAVIGVTEGVAIGARVRSRGPVGLAIVTNAARRDLTTGRCFARRCVTGVTTVVCSEVRWDRETNTAIDCRVVTA